MSLAAAQPASTPAVLPSSGGMRGALSDLFGAGLGEAAGLRWALIAASVFYPLSALHFWLASRHVKNDLEA